MLKTASQVWLPAAFVLLWSSGFIAAKIVLGHTETLIFLGARYAVVTLLMADVAYAMRVPQPNSWFEVGHIAVAGTLLRWRLARDGQCTVAHGTI